MTIWHRNRRGRGCTTPRCRSQNIANNTFSEGWLQNPTNLQVCGPRQQPTMQKTLQIQRFHAECCKTQVLGPYHVGGGGVVANREPGSYILYIHSYQSSDKVVGSFFLSFFYTFTQTTLVICWNNCWRSKGKRGRHRWWCTFTANGSENFPLVHGHPKNIEIHWAFCGTTTTHPKGKIRPKRTSN